MPGYFTFKESNCKNCYKCIRHCPVKAIGFSKNQAHILEDECILCGQCFINCPQNAKNVRDDLPAVQSLLRQGVPVYASVAPSVAAVYPRHSFEQITEALKNLGFAGAENTSHGATLVKKRYEQIINEGKQSVILSSCCPSVNTLVRKYYPHAASNLAQVTTPMLAHGALLKNRHDGCKTVFIGPCIAKKAEAEQNPGAIDAVLTFEELAIWLEQTKALGEPSNSPTKGTKAGLFPTAGGIIGSMDINPGAGYTYMPVDGLENCIAALEDLTNGGLSRVFLEMSACAGSCICGPVIGKARLSPIKDRLAIKAHTGERDLEIGGTPPPLDKKISATYVSRVKPGSKSIDEVLRKMGKTLPEHELNCGSCGYETCRQKAEAVLAGKAETAMCLPFLMARAESFSDTIISNTPNGILVLNSQMEIQQINKAASRLMNIPDETAILGRNVVCVLDPQPFLQASKMGEQWFERHIYLAEYRRHVSMTIVCDENYDIIIALMRDVTQEHTERQGKDERGRKAIEIADKVIERQMRTVQEIASLLGETTAETKVALERLKDTLV